MLTSFREKGQTESGKGSSENKIIKHNISNLSKNTVFRTLKQSFL